MFQDIVSLITTPFVGTLDIEHLFLIVGLVLVFFVAWIFIFEHIRAASMEAF